MEKMNRNTFLKLANAGFLALLIFIWNKLTLSEIAQSQSEKKILPFNKNKTVYFSGDFIIICKDEEVKVLSAHCSHLGCLINNSENNKLICPCHGSEFDLDGNSIKGPAHKGLSPVAYKISTDGNTIEIV